MRVWDPHVPRGCGVRVRSAGAEPRPRGDFGMAVAGTQANAPTHASAEEHGVQRVQQRVLVWVAGRRLERRVPPRRLTVRCNQRRGRTRVVSTLLLLQRQVSCQRVRGAAARAPAAPLARTGGRAVQSRRRELAVVRGGVAAGDTVLDHHLPAVVASLSLEPRCCLYTKTSRMHVIEDFLWNCELVNPEATRAALDCILGRATSQRIDATKHTKTSLRTRVRRAQGTQAHVTRRMPRLA